MELSLLSALSAEKICNHVLLQSIVEVKKVKNDSPAMRLWTIGIVTGALLLFAVQVCAINRASDIRTVQLVLDSLQLQVIGMQVFLFGGYTRELTSLTDQV